MLDEHTMRRIEQAIEKFEEVVERLDRAAERLEEASERGGDLRLTQAVTEIREDVGRILSHTETGG